MYCGIASCVRFVSSSRSGLRKLSRGFSSARRPAPTFSSRLARCLLDCLSQARPPRMPHGFTYCGSLLRRWVGSTAGAAISNFSLLPTSGVYPQSVCLSSLSDPSSAATPQSCLGGSLLVCLNHDPNQNCKVFVGVNSFIGNDKFTPSPLTRSSDNFTRSRHASADPQLICLLSAGAAHLTLVV